MPGPIHISRGQDRHAAALTAPRKLGPLDPVAVRIREHSLELRSRVAFGIAVDASHQCDITVARRQYCRELERAVQHLDRRNTTALRALWASAYSAAVHDPVSDPRLGVCPRCDLADRVHRRPGELVPPGRLTNPQPGPPVPGSWMTEAAIRLPRVRNQLAQLVAQYDAHGDKDETARAVRVLTSTEERLVRDHLDLTLAAVPAWAALESAWSADPQLLHDGCHTCWSAHRQRAVR